MSLSFSLWKRTCEISAKLIFLWGPTMQTPVQTSCIRPAQPPQNRARMSQITRFTDYFPFKCDKGVGCEHDPTRVKPGDS